MNSNGHEGGKVKARAILLAGLLCFGAVASARAEVVTFAEPVTVSAGYNRELAGQVLQGVDLIDIDVARNTYWFRLGGKVLALVSPTTASAGNAAAEIAAEITK